MRTEKKQTVNADRHTLRILTFSMAFVMLFVIPLLQMLTGCQAGKVASTGSRHDTLAINRDPSSTALTTLRTATVGGLGGSTISRRMDELASMLQSNAQGVSIVRREEGIIALFDSRELFDDDSYDLQGSARRTLKEFVRSLKQVEDIGILVEGHTDDTAEEAYNYHLSGRRANAVSQFFIRQGIRESHIRSRGYGEKQPLVADTSTIAREMNRRIEVVWFAGDDPRRLAAHGKLEGLIASKRSNKD
jgi:outer membrane protein OmpA-like peptidoglycan-associated protein